MAKADIAALLALGAAFFIAIGNVLHQRSAREVTDEPVGNLTLFLNLLRDRQWWLGSGVAAGGFALQAAALGLGSVLMVQAVLVTSLLFALPISAHQSHRRVSRWHRQSWSRQPRSSRGVRRLPARVDELPGFGDHRQGARASLVAC